MSVTDSLPAATGYQALGTGVALFGLARGSLRVAGRDRADFLHGLLTNDVKKLAQGSGCYAALLTAKGKMLADLTVLCRAEALTLDCEEELSGKLDGLLRKYHFYHQVEIRDLTASTGVLHVAGPGAPDVLRRLGAAELPARPHDNRETRLSGETVLVVAEPRTGSPGYDLRLPLEASHGLRHALEAAGAAPAPAGVLEAARIGAGIPRWGFELDETVLPNEARLERSAISYDKGCYIGQETVARIRTYGHVNRLLVLLHLGSPAARGDEIRAEDQKAGSVTSAAHSPSLGTTVALGYVKREHAETGKALTVMAASGPVGAVVAPFACT